MITMVYCSVTDEDPEDGEDEEEEDEGVGDLTDAVGTRKKKKKKRRKQKKSRGKLSDKPQDFQVTPPAFVIVSFVKHD